MKNLVFAIAGLITFEARSEQGVYPFASAADLRQFGDMVGEHEVVGIGEAVHGNESFLAEKARLTRYLIEEKGFRVIGFETGWMLTKPLADYLATCSGNDEAAMNAAIPLFASESTLELIKWICSFNARNPDDRVGVFGFDINQYAPTQNVSVVKEYLPGVDFSKCAGLQPHSNLSKDKYTYADFYACLASIYSAKAIFANKIYDERDIIRFNVAIDSLKATQEVAFYFTGKPRQNVVYEHIDANDRFSEARDDQMAKNFFALRSLHQGSKKAVIWAHNDHIKIKDGSAKTLGYHIAMGTFTPDKGVKYFALGLLAKSMTTGHSTSHTPPGDYLENIFSNLGLEKCLIDLSKITLLASYRPYAYNYFNGQQAAAVPAEEYSGFLYLENAP